MFGFGKSKHEAIMTPQPDPRQSQEWAEYVQLIQLEVARQCAAHLDFLASLAYDAWDDAENKNDLNEVLLQYCAALDGSEEYIRNLFAPLEQQLRASGGEGGDIWNYVRMNKLAHHLQVKTFFEFKLKVSMFPLDQRPKWREEAAAFLHPAYRNEL